jgi:hypothetical protein
MSLKKSMEDNIKDSIKKYIDIISQKYNIPKEELLDMWERRIKKPVQAHGFSWEKELLINIYRLTELLFNIVKNLRIQKEFQV